MTPQEKVKQLKGIIEQALDLYIDRDYVYLDLPYHRNVGDTMIAMGAMHYLARFKYKCLYRSSEYTFDDRPISPDTLIIFHGGGNFGDLWYNCTAFRNKIISKYPNHHFLILPQSVMYSDSAHLKEDVELYSSCPHITICARDRQSYDFLKQHFTANNVLLVPDMAFYLDEHYLEGVMPQDGADRTLYLKRNDKEFVETAHYAIVPTDAEVHDWPTMEHKPFPYRLLKFVKTMTKIFIRPFSKKTAWHIWDAYWRRCLHPYIVKVGVNFVGQYSTVYTTRLHVAITCVLLGKKVIVFDNNYHKNSALYNTWLQDVDTILVIR